MGWYHSSLLDLTFRLLQMLIVELQDLIFSARFWTSFDTILLHLPVDIIWNGNVYLASLNFGNV